MSIKFIMLINVKMPTIFGISTFTSMINIFGILTFISIINTTSNGVKARKVFVFQHFSFYEQLKFHAILS